MHSQEHGPLGHDHGHDAEKAGSSSAAEKSGSLVDSPHLDDQHIVGIETSAAMALHRGLKARHITMIAIGGAIGTGLIIGTGKALAQARGPRHKYKLYI